MRCPFTRERRQKGEVAAFLTILALGLIILGTLVGSWTVRNGPLKTESGATGTCEVCDGVVTVQVYQDKPNCDGRYQVGVDTPLSGVEVKLSISGEEKERKITGYNGRLSFNRINLDLGEEAVFEVVNISEADFCPGSGKRITLGTDDFGSFGNKYIEFGTNPGSVVQPIATPTSIVEPTATTAVAPIATSIPIPTPTTADGVTNTPIPTAGTGGQQPVPNQTAAPDQYEATANVWLPDGEHVGNSYFSVVNDKGQENTLVNGINNIVLDTINGNPYNDGEQAHLKLRFNNQDITWDADLNRWKTEEASDGSQYVMEGTRCESQGTEGYCPDNAGRWCPVLGKNQWGAGYDSCQATTQGFLITLGAKYNYGWIVRPLTTATPTQAVSCSVAPEIRDLEPYYTARWCWGGNPPCSQQNQCPRFAASCRSGSGSDYGDCSDDECEWVQACGYSSAGSQDACASHGFVGVRAKCTVGAKIEFFKNGASIGVFDCAGLDSFVGVETDYDYDQNYTLSAEGFDPSNRSNCNVKGQIINMVGCSCGDWSPGPSGPSPTPGPIGDGDKKVLLIVFDPFLDPVGQKATDYYYFNDPYQLAADHISDMNRNSGGNADYRIDSDDRIEYDGYVPKDGQVFTDEEYMRCVDYRGKPPDSNLLVFCQKNVGEAGYNWIMNSFNICDEVENDDISEVWMYGGPWYGFWEWHDVSCGRTKLTVYGFNYERGRDEMREDRIHDAERKLEACLGHELYSEFDGTFRYERYGSLNEKGPPSCQVEPKRNPPEIENEHVSCGDAHFTPNSACAYIYDFPENTNSRCSEWRTFPNVGDNYAVINCSIWGCSQGSFQDWWFEALPRNDGISVYNGREVPNNWWECLNGDFSQQSMSQSSITSSEYATGEEELYRDLLQADLNGNGVVDEEDFDQIIQHFGDKGSNLRWDMNNDKLVNSADIIMLMQLLGREVVSP